MGSVSDVFDLIDPSKRDPYGTSGNTFLGEWQTSRTLGRISAAQLKDKFALPYTPTNITPVTIEAGSTIRVGEAAPIKGYGNGGGFQIEKLKGEVKYGKTEIIQN